MKYLKCDTQAIADNVVSIMTEKVSVTIGATQYLAPATFEFETKFYVQSVDELYELIKGEGGLNILSVSAMPPLEEKFVGEMHKTENRASNGLLLTHKLYAYINMEGGMGDIDAANTAIGLLQPFESRLRRGFFELAFRLYFKDIKPLAMLSANVDAWLISEMEIILATYGLTDEMILGLKTV